jgi:hypothetical protein
LKSVERPQPVHSKQLLTYRRLTGCRLGLLINFGENLLKDGFKRVVTGWILKRFFVASLCRRVINFLGLSLTKGDKWRIKGK